MNIDQLKVKYIPKIIGGGINVIGLFTSQKAVSIALDIFRTPRKGRVQSYQKKFLKKFKRVELSFDKMLVATYDNGKPGRKILLCHGWESNSYRWRKLYKELNKTDHNVIFMDAPAHGGSGSERFDGEIYAGFISAALEHYKPDVLIGHSVGAYSVLYAMSEYKPTSVHKLVILASADKFTDISERYFNMIGLSTRLRKKYLEKVESVFGRPANYYNAADFAKNIEAEGMIIHDKEDNVNLFYEAEAIHNSWPNSKLISTTGFGHSLQDESVYKLVMDYVS
ncbi:MAG: alpha-beta hydrolase superfamily lysophospholipase [Saprospiraceae bacterium]|jgi:alpha-beta hydrolase superfamily lysophospholipase|tara:strand:- start:671 stop:1513 length:843 start_codon:yes stop_codon:yes gene_type:complete